MKIHILAILLLGLIGCHSAPRLVDDTPVLPQAVEGSSDFAIVKLQSKLMKEGVRVISMGQMYMISIPSKLIFAEESPRIQWGAYTILDDVVCYLQKFRKVAVHVNAYGSCYQSERRTRALTLARGREVANYLWTQNVDTRLVIAQGLGDARPISIDKSCSDSSPNSRIEIIFERAVA